MCVSLAILVISFPPSDLARCRYLQYMYIYIYIQKCMYIILHVIFHAHITLYIKYIVIHLCIYHQIILYNIIYHTVYIHALWYTIIFNICMYIYVPNNCLKVPMLLDSTLRACPAGLVQPGSSSLSVEGSTHATEHLVQRLLPGWPFGWRGWFMWRNNQIMSPSCRYQGLPKDLGSHFNK